MTADSAGPAAGPGSASALSVEDEKLVTLARAALGRIDRSGAGTTGAVDPSREREGAAVRDEDGRTYAAATVRLPSFRLTALQAAVAAAVTSGASELEAAVIVREVTPADPAEPDHASVAAARDLGAPLLMVVDPSGSVLHRMTWAG